jgi:hypothetical protein
MFSNINVDYINKVFLMFLLTQIVQKCDLNWVCYKIDFYIFVQHISMHLILISISIVDLNIKILK